ncbi:uncharacterized protein LOC135367540 [Ornithodoros turicata]|uniref:uncharacterized protein LOC135367540 n=1 Tax=Ornithodoros turicata TaxID=34597 RepID=UPI00313930F4
MTRGIIALLLLRSALALATPPKLESGGWKPILGPAVRDKVAKQPVTGESVRRTARSDSRHDVPAFYVWLPTELLENIQPQRNNLQRHRPNYLPHQNIADINIEGLLPPAPRHFHNAFPAHLQPKTPVLTVQDNNLRVGYNGARAARPLGRPPPDFRELPRPSPGLIDDVPRGGIAPKPEKIEFSQPLDTPVRGGGYGADAVQSQSLEPQQPGSVSNEDVPYQPEEPTNPENETVPKEPETRPHRPQGGYGTGQDAELYGAEQDAELPDTPTPPDSVQEEESPSGSPSKEDAEQGIGQIDPRSAATCSPVTSAAGAVTNLGNRSLRQVAESVGAGEFFDRVDLSEELLDSAVGQEEPFTLFLISDANLDLINPALLDTWRSDKDALRKALQNHVLANRVALEELVRGGPLTTKAGALLHVHSHPHGVVTVNGQRLVRADVSGPRGSIVHVLGGPLTPLADRDIGTTLTECDKYEGFLTLATGTGVVDILKVQGRHREEIWESTLFLPSNDALSKIPKEQLQVYQNNVTALKEFLMYHVAEGIHYSHDLRDGQYLRSRHNGHPVRVSVNLDGCNRRLYEANNSPLYRADIPASNGVIHVIDWVLLPEDHNWCHGVILP